MKNKSFAVPLGFVFVASLLGLYVIWNGLRGVNVMSLDADGLRALQVQIKSAVFTLTYCIPASIIVSVIIGYRLQNRTKRAKAAKAIKQSKKKASKKRKSPRPSQASTKESVLDQIYREAYERAVADLS